MKFPRRFPRSPVPVEVRDVPVLEPAPEPEEVDPELEARLDVVLGELGHGLNVRVFQILSRANVSERTARAMALNQLCEANNVTVEAVNRRLAEGQELWSAYSDWLKAKGLDKFRGDRQQNAKDVAVALERRKMGLELRMKDRKLGAESRIRLDEEMEDLERAEDRTFAQLHPALVFGERRRDEAVCRCGRGMNRREKFSLGRCKVCRDEYEARFGQPWRAVI